VLASGPNTVTLGGLDFDRKNSGAGIFAILDTGAGGTVALRDGNDFAFNIIPSPLDTTTPQTITFPTVTADTVVEPLFFVSSVDNEMPRSSVIRFTFDTGDVVEFGNVLNNTDGDEWDTFRGPVTVPAGASSATVQILSQLPTGQTEGPQPASLVWNLAAVAIPSPAQVGGLQVVKTISGATDGFVPGTVFTVAVDCDGTEFDTTFDLTPGGTPGSVTGMPGGTVCTVTETGVPDAAPDFDYGTPTYTPGQTVTITEDATVEVVIDNPLTQASITVMATPICINDTPYIDYVVQLNQITAPNGVTIRFTNTSTGEIVLELTNQPLTGRILWPGAVVDASGEPIDWPGWEFVDGEWIEVDDGLRPEIDMTVEVNPTDTVRVEYPPPEPLCNPNPNGGLQVTKAIIAGIEGYVPGSTFEFSLSCTDPTFDETFTLPEGGTFVKENITVATGCTVTETSRPDTVAGWAWVEPQYAPAQSVTVVETTSTLEVRVLNQLSEGSIPNTGSDSVDMGLFGFILMALGGVFVVSAQIVRRIH
jgi:LPXTG-motif cell wall-anchored protein